jgi:hypothetical protein
MTGAVEHADELLQILWQARRKRIVVLLRAGIPRSHHRVENCRRTHHEHSALLSCRQPEGERRADMDRLTVNIPLSCLAPRLRPRIGIVQQGRRLAKPHRPAAHRIS